MHHQFPDKDVFVAPSGSLHSSYCVGSSPAIRAMEQVIRELSASEVPVLIRAEAGSGKRTVAHRIHHLSGRHSEPFVGVDCASLSREALADGAQSLFLRGTVVLEEISGLDADCQQLLFDLLPGVDAEGRKHRLGSRLLFTTSKDLTEEVRAGRFREDLCYRLRSLRLPPLRERRQDISELMNFFLAKYAGSQRRPVPRLSAEAQRWIEEYDWPGNVRELEDAAKALVMLGEQALVRGGARHNHSHVSGNGAKVSLKDASRAASREAERALILSVLNRTRWNRRRAAQELQISYKALLYKLKQIGMEEYGAS
jgi:two-component system, NtrC family, response regulator AtoC